MVMGDHITLRHRIIHANTLIYLGMYSQLYPRRGTSVYSAERETALSPRNVKCQPSAEVRRSALTGQTGYVDKEPAISRGAQKRTHGVDGLLEGYIKCRPSAEVRLNALSGLGGRLEGDLGAPIGG